METRRIYLSLLLAITAFVACDSVQPDASDQLVVQAFLDAGKPLPPVTVRKTTGLAASQREVAGAIVSDAVVDVRINGSSMPYEASSASGRYAPLESSTVLAGGDHFVVEISWNNQTASAAGRIPPQIGVDSV
ncbi:MAG: DUF4249 family protein, partial [Rhodothermales bacterium]|nr:DUF4249 family protein [Rhodothermales bacterium]